MKPAEYCNNSSTYFKLGTKPAAKRLCTDRQTNICLTSRFPSNHNQTNKFQTKTMHTKNKQNKNKSINAHTIFACLAGSILLSTNALADNYDELPIGDAHVHYSHDSVEMTPPERVIELMRDANLKFALVSSSDDNGTQLLSEIAPDLIVPGLRPYRRRGELGSWFQDDAALAYVEDLLAKNQYASIGEFHISGDNALLPIPKRIVELANEHNLVLHAHSDSNAIEHLLAQNDTVKVLWAHAGFEGPEELGDMLRKHDRLWADLAFRGEVGSSGQLSEGWIDLFTEFPDRVMLGTDTYTPERMYYIPEHAAGARTWLTSLPYELAERVAWKNAHDLLMPIWNTNKAKGQTSAASTTHALDNSACTQKDENTTILTGDAFIAAISVDGGIEVSKAFSAMVTVCANSVSDIDMQFNATMPSHGHGMNYTPKVSLIESTDNVARYRVDGLVMHMPGEWQWSLIVSSENTEEKLEHSFKL